MADNGSSENRFAHLTPLQVEVTQHSATERPFENEFWDHEEAGIYVGVVSGEPPFASIHKYDSGSGWRSFFRALNAEQLVEIADQTASMVRTEIRSRDANSHLGHVCPDGPAPTRLRYCINSAALRFVSVNDLEEHGYGKFLPLFDSD